MNMMILSLIAVLLVGVSILLLRNESLKRVSLNWLYVLSIGLAWYSIETATRAEPFHKTMLIALLLCLIPMFIDGLIHAVKNAELNRIRREKFLSSLHH